MQSHSVIGSRRDFATKVLFKSSDQVASWCLNNTSTLDCLCHLEGSNYPPRRSAFGWTYSFGRLVYISSSSHGEQVERPPEEVVRRGPHGNIQEGQGYEKDQKDDAPLQKQQACHDQLKGQS